MPRVTAGEIAAVQSSGVAELVSLFASDLGSLMTYDSFRYRHPERGIEVALGAETTHSCSYRITRDGDFLGEILLSRKLPFKESELQQLERCLGALTPLLTDQLSVR